MLLDTGVLCLLLAPAEGSLNWSVWLSQAQGYASVGEKHPILWDAP